MAFERYPLRQNSASAQTIQACLLSRKKATLSWHHLGLLIVVAFAVSLTANVVSPLMPSLLATYSFPQEVRERHTAFINGGYLLAMFIAGPVLGALSDQIGRRAILLSGLAVYTLSLYAVAMASSLPGLYLGRILSGIGAGALVPVMLAHIADHSRDASRVRQFAWLTTAVMTGALVGPYLGGLATKLQTGGAISTQVWSTSAPVPILAGAIASSAILVTMVWRFPSSLRHRRNLASYAGVPRRRPMRLYALFALSIILMYAVGSFEVGLATLARTSLQLDAAQLGLMYTACALVMLVMQALFFADPFKHFANRHLLFPAFITTAIAIVLFPQASSIEQLGWAVAGVAGGAGLIAPMISYRVSLLAHGQQGKSFGLQSAFSNLGQALGSVGSGMLFGLSPQLPFQFAAAILLAGALWALFHLSSGPQLLGTSGKTKTN